jgi:uncharacterized protein
VARLAALLVALIVWVAPALAQAPAFPALSGRVVDAAGVLSAEDRAALSEKLEAHERRTSDQVVVATVPSLGGLAVEDYANRLYRTWALGTKERSNGALLLVAPSERKVRIEVGYGLEGALTDALSKVIIATAIVPRFRANDFPGGIRAGVDGVLQVLSGDADEWQRRPPVREDRRDGVDLVVVIVVLVLVVLFVSGIGRRGGGRPHRTRGGRWIVLPTPSGGGWGGGFGGGFSGGSSGGFSGGGGSSGGGGASGSW